MSAPTPPASSASMDDAANSPRTGLWVSTGFVILFVCIGGFTAWATSAPLHSAAAASGIVKSDTNRKAVQHLEGGIVEHIYVKNGDAVNAGDVLIRLDDAQARTSVEVLRARWYALKAKEARLLAEQNGSEHLTLPKLVDDAAQEAVFQELFNGQHAIFQYRAAALQSQLDILNTRKKQLGAQISSLKAQTRSATTQLSLIAEEHEGVAELVEKGLEKRTRLINLQRQQAEIAGRLGEYQGQIAKAEQSIGETDIQMINVQDNRRSEVATELNATQIELSDTEERYRAAVDILKRTDILAVTPGTVVNMQLFTPGGVISPGMTVMEIVPRDDKLVIEARVTPNDIDIVKAGLPVEVRFTAYGQRDTPPVVGQVETVSADALVDEGSQSSYYLARISVTPEELGRTAPNVNLTPGMPAEVMIVTGQKTVMSYLVEPLTSSLRHAFREN